MAAAEKNKAKTARRVIEVLQFFDDQNRQMTVMDIVRRYNRPQSSTSELLASLVELGMLYKDSRSRSYTLTPRAAILGSLSQPGMIRDGSLTMLIDRLLAQTGLGTMLLGTVGLQAQIFRWCAATKAAAAQPGRLGGGAQEYLTGSAAGWLLLSAIPGGRRESVIRRLNAELPLGQKFDYAEMVQRVQTCGRQGYAVGPAGFGSTAETTAVLLPTQLSDMPMVLGFAYQPHDAIEALRLVDLLQTSVQRCLRWEGDDGDGQTAAMNAAMLYRLQPAGAALKAM